MTSTLVLLTGASRGIGAALVAAAPEASTIVEVSRSGTSSARVEHVDGDLADAGSWAVLGDALTERIRRFTGGRIVVWFVAGVIDPIGFAGDVDDAAYTDSVVINSAAHQVLGHRLLRALAEHEARADLVVISSGAASGAYPGWSAYGAGKAALDQWVRTVGAEQDERGDVRVLSVAPGVVATSMQERIREQTERDFPNVERFRGLHRDGALADPDDVARRLWALLDRRDLANGSVLDLRTLA